jgi:hypothetical protein
LELVPLDEESGDIAVFDRLHPLVIRMHEIWEDSLDILSDESDITLACLDPVELYSLDTRQLGIYTLEWYDIGLESTIRAIEEVCGSDLIIDF